MGARAEVFISATTRELRSYREEVKNALLTLKILPIEERNFPLAYGPLVTMLRDLIGPCDAVIHLAGFYYGAEPAQRRPGEPRRSYTQIEYDVARELKKPLYLFLATEDYEPDKLFTQSDEEEELQLTHRRVIEECGDIYYRFAGREELGGRIRELHFPARRAEAPRRVVNLPYESLGPLFKGRDTALAELRQRLGSGGKSAMAIHGLGGVGKTRLAIEYAWRYPGDYTALLFINAGSPADLRANLAGLSSPLVLNLPEWNQPEEIIRLAAVFRWLDEHSGWLLIVDNVDTRQAATAVEETLPQLQRGQVIITSRIAIWGATVQKIGLDVLAEKDATAFLLERTEPLRVKRPGDGDDAAGLAGDLGGLALALEQAAAYIAKKHFSFSEYRERWKLRKEEVLAWYDEQLMKYPRSVAVTWQTTIDQLSQPERKLLDILASLAPEPIPVLLLEGKMVDGADARDALAELASWSLVRWTADGDGFTVHRLVQEITRQRLPDDQKDDSLDLALAILDGGLPAPEWDRKGWQL